MKNKTVTERNIFVWRQNLNGALQATHQQLLFKIIDNSALSYVGSAATQNLGS